jgi:hypothetical protein
MKIAHMANRFLVAGILTALLVTVGNAQTSPPSGQKTLAATMDVYVFPSAGQTPETQSKDEAACYQWAVQNTGTDPFELNKQSQQQAQQTQQAQKQAQQVGTGAGVAGAARGAAAGALIGEIASDNPGKGAAWGAVAGVVAGRRRGRAAQAQAQNEVAKQGQQAQQATSNQIANFKKAFSVCLEAKKYMVKY